MYHQFHTFIQGRTSLLITHRFSTVSMADSIAVLEEGQIIACGSHQELLAQGGTYATLYMMQAANYLKNEHGSLETC